MHNIQINPASNRDAEAAAALTFMAYHRFSYDILGDVGEESARLYFKKLWLYGHNRFGRRFSYISKVDGKAVGLMTCYPAGMLTKLAVTTIGQLVLIGKFRFIRHFCTHLLNFYAFASGSEANSDDFYVSTLSVLPEYRGKGIGTEMLRYARKIARVQNYKRCVLHVNAENESGIRFYEQNGFEKSITPSHKEKPVYFRMVYSF